MALHQIPHLAMPDWQRCPYCDSGHIEGGSVEINEAPGGQFAEQVMTCGTCGRNWTEVYRADYRNVDQPDPVPHDGHELAADWNRMYRHDVIWRTDGHNQRFIVVDTSTEESISDSEGETEWWCKTCDRELTDDEAQKIAAIVADYR